MFVVIAVVIVLVLARRRVCNIRKESSFYHHFCARAHHHHHKATREDVVVVVHHAASSSLSSSLRFGDVVVVVRRRRRRRFVFRRCTRVEPPGRRRRCIIIYDWIPFDICVRARRERAPAADKIDESASRNVKYRVNHVRIRRTDEQRWDWHAVYRVGETVRQKWAFRDRRVHRRGEVRAAAAQRCATHTHVSSIVTSRERRFCKSPPPLTSPVLRVLTVVIPFSFYFCCTFCCYSIGVKTNRSRTGSNTTETNTTLNSSDCIDRTKITSDDTY